MGLEVNTERIQFLCCENYFVVEEDDIILGVVHLNEEKYFVFKPMEDIIFTCRQLATISSKISELNID